MIYIGIDPGKSGAYAILYPNGIVVKPMAKGDFDEAMREVAAHEEPKIACVELVGAMPGQGVTSMFNFGKSFGYIEGVLQALQIPYQLISPRTWKKEFRLNSDKENSIEVCKKLFPQVNLLATPRCKNEHDGIAEALLMAEFTRRNL